MKRRMAICLGWLILLCSVLGVPETGLSRARAESESLLQLEGPPDEIRPGRACVLSFTVPRRDMYDLVVVGGEGKTVSAVFLDREMEAGYHAIYWNGTFDGIAAPEGSWELELSGGGDSTRIPIRIGPLAPMLISARLEEETVLPGEEAVVCFFATEAGTLTLHMDEMEILRTEDIRRGENELRFPAEGEAGTHALMLLLESRQDGLASETVRLTLTIQASETETAQLPAAPVTPGPGAEERWREIANTGFTPVHTSPEKGRDPELNYWTLPMDITDEEAVWHALTQPITVLDNGKKNAEKTQVVIRSGPDEESEGIGVVTCMTQGVHVLSRDTEWSLIECYSSSFHDSPILNWNALVQGYVPTAFLTEVIPDQELGIVIDKLTQRLYLFREGRLLSTLLVSTGLANRRQPYNETRAGEFLMTSAVGTFSSDDMKCALALRFNRGDLLHEVPYTVLEDGTKYYRSTELKLGQKASHGCIRVQRKKTPEGISQSWIWANRKKNLRILIWEDWQGRQIPVPEAETPLYCNPARDRYYHTSENCYEAQEAKLRAFTYGQLEEEEYAGLRRCEYCAPPLRQAEIEEINAVYAPGGDHNPVLTEALKKCPRRQKRK